MGQNFCGFRGSPNIRENFIRELGVLAVLSRDSGQHPRKFYLRIFIVRAIRENFVPQKFPAIRYDIEWVWELWVEATQWLFTNKIAKFPYTMHPPLNTVHVQCIHIFESVPFDNFESGMGSP